MTVDSAYAIEKYAENGGMHYHFEHESIGATAIAVYVISAGVRTLLPSTEYTLTFGFRDPINTRGFVTLNTPLAADDQLQIERQTPITNDHVFAPGKPFEAETFEFAIDKMTFILQELEGSLCDCRVAKTTPGYVPDPNDPHDADGPSYLPQCSPYSCAAIETFINTNSGWPMTDPQISLTPPADGYYRGGQGNLRLSLPTVGGVPPINSPDWDATEWHDVTGFVGAPDYCVAGAKFATVITQAFGSTRCGLDNAGVSAETLTPDFAATYFLIGTGNNEVLTESLCQYITAPNGQNYFFHMRVSTAISAGSVIVSYQAIGSFQTIDLGPPPFDVNKPYVLTQHIQGTQAPSGSSHTWTSSGTIKVKGFGGEITHTLNEVESYAGLGTTITPNAGTGQINLFRGSELGVDSLGVIYGDYYDSAWIALQRNFTSYVLPPECASP